MKNGWIYILLMLGFWCILTEKLTYANIAVGLLIAAMAYNYAQPAYKGLNLWIHIQTVPLWILFLIQLIVAIVVANFQVAKIVLSRRMPIQPKLVQYNSQIRNELLLTVLANAITLTPGTMSVDIKGSEILIHCLTDEYAKSLEGNIFEKTLLRIQEVSHA